MKQVTHGVNKDEPRFLPSFWYVQHLRMTINSEAISIICLAHGLQAKRHALGITIQASG
jgi:hypothetical protein